MPTYIPQIDWSPLARLPEAYEAGRLQAARRSLADEVGKLDKPADFERLGARALQLGLPLNEVNALFSQAATRRGIEQRGQLDPISRFILENYNANRGRPPPTVGGGEGGEAAPQGPTLSPTVPDTAPPGPQSALPPSPTEQVLAQAERPAPPPPPPPAERFAGPVTATPAPAAPAPTAPAPTAPAAPQFKPGYEGPDVE